MSENLEAQSKTSIPRVLGSLLIVAALRCVLVTTSFRSIKARQKGEATDTVPATPVSEERAEFYYNTIKELQDFANERAKHLLALSSSLAAFLVVFAPGTQPNWITYGAVLSLLVAVCLSVALLGVQTSMIPSPEPQVDDPDGHQWARDLLRSAIFNEQRVRFLIDLYSGARRWLLVALGLLCIVLALPEDEPEHPLQSSLRELTNQLTGGLEELTTVVDSLGLRLDASYSAEAGDRPSAGARTDTLQTEARSE